jgi:hypothetical protein
MSNRDLERRLRALREPAPPPDLETRLERGIPDSVRRPETGWIPGRVWTMAKAAAAVVVLGFVGWIAAILLGGPPTLAAVLEPVAEATGRRRGLLVRQSRR